MEALINDTERLNKFLEILPEIDVYEFLNHELCKAQYIDQHANMIDEYNQYKQTVLSHFHNQKIEDAKKIFDLVFDKLHSFLLNNFYQLGDSHLMGLLPQDKFSNWNFWGEKLNELTLLCNEFEKKYKTLITIANLPKLEISNHEEGSKTQEENNKPIFPYPLPAGTTWKNMVITFLDDENVFISVKNKELNINYAGMGFLDKRCNISRPNEAWLFLRTLAELYGELTSKDPQRREKYVKQKELLSKSLKYYFSISDDPFYPFKDPLPKNEKNSNSYKIRITLSYQKKKEEPKKVDSYLSYTETKTETPEEKLDRETAEYFKEQTPSKYTFNEK
ncbi:MAG: hypothetical protein NT094_03850 [Candidatus Staskawiczbacteria bacterium]|nr:hypothetical protein [Candidatus Staskawiczbacteria bacterium]